MAGGDIPPYNDRRPPSGSRAALIGLGGALAAFLYATAIEPASVEVVHWDIFAPRLPKEFEGYTIYQLSDLHTIRFGPLERRVANLIERLPEPDLAVFTGDMIHTRRGTEPFMRLASGLRARDGVYAVTGNSEYKNGIRHVEFAARMQEGGIRTLYNQHVVLERNGAEIALAGVEDPRSDHDDLALALTGIPDNVFKLVLMHTPDGVAEAVLDGVDLVLSGHTHGGQVRLPLLGALFTHSVMGARLSAGHYKGIRLRVLIGIRPGRTQLYVSRGLGVSGLALRFLCRPELTILTLRRGFPACRPPITKIKTART